MTPEFSRPVDLRHLGDRPHHLVATPQERAKLAERLEIEAVDRLEADIALMPEGAKILATGRFTAEVVQACAVSGEPFAVAIDEPLALRFVPDAAAHRPGEEIELDASDCDEIEFEDGSIDLGETVAQSLALAIDPYATGPDADAVRAAVGLSDEGVSGPFAALAALRKP